MKPDQFELHMEYRGEGLYLYWNNPFNGGAKEDLLMFMWPSHPVEDTQRVEDLYEHFADLFANARRYKRALEIQAKRINGLIPWQERVNVWLKDASQSLLPVDAQEQTGSAPERAQEGV